MGIIHSIGKAIDGIRLINQFGGMDDFIKPSQTLGSFGGMDKVSRGSSEEKDMARILFVYI